jgi:acyl dehydratase
MSAPSEFVSPPVSRVAIAWVCVATNDGHPLHLDHEFARRAGFKDVVVPGHLLIGWMGQYLEDWCGDPRNVLNWKIRFTAPVWPGDRLTLKGEMAPDSPRGDVRKVTVTATSEDGKVCGVATAELRMSAG